MWRTDGAEPFTAAVARLYAELGLPPPAVLIAREPGGFVRGLALAAPLPRLGTLVLLALLALLPGLLASVIGRSPSASLAGDGLLVLAGVLATAVLFGAVPGSEPPEQRVREERRAALLVVGSVAVAAGLVLGSIRAGAVGFACAASALAFLRLAVLVNGGWPGRLGLLVGGSARRGRPLPLVLGPAPFVGADGEAASPALCRIEELGRRRLDWRKVGASLLLGRQARTSRRTALLEALGRTPASKGARDAAIALDARCELAALFERLVILLVAAPEPKPSSWRRWWRPARSPFAEVLAELDTSLPWRLALGLLPHERWALRLLARLIVEEPDPGLRLAAIERMGPDRFFAVLGLPPVDRSAVGTLFVVGPRPLATALVRVVDPVPSADGGEQVHWLPVPPSVRTAREAVAWTFGKAERDYRPEVET